MRIFDPHIHMTSRTTDDYERMAAAGVRALVEPAFWLGQPRTSVGSFTDYFDALVGWERFRASQFGIAHHCTIALNPKEANDPRCAEVLDVLRRLASEGTTMILVTHEMRFAREVSQRAIVLHDGAVAEDGAPAEVFDHAQDARTRAFLGYRQK